MTPRDDLIEAVAREAERRYPLLGVAKRDEVGEMVSMVLDALSRGPLRDQGIEAGARALYNTDGDRREGWRPWQDLVFDDPMRVSCHAAADRALAAFLGVFQEEGS